jgi:ribonuclease-3
MSRRYNALVARETCAEVGRALGLPPFIRLGKQAREDQANLSDNVVGDVVEAVIGALYRDAGLERAEAFVRTHWAPFLEGQRKAPEHPKSALQEIAAEKKLGVPAYELLARFGPHHAPRFRVKVSLGKHGEAEAEGDSKQEAETAAAAALLDQIR